MTTDTTRTPAQDIDTATMDAVHTAAGALSTHDQDTLAATLTTILDQLPPAPGRGDAGMRRRMAKVVETLRSR